MVRSCLVITALACAAAGRPVMAAQGGNRTPAGARAQGVLMSVLETCRRHTRSAVDHVSQTLRWFVNRLLPRPQLLGR